MGEPLRVIHSPDKKRSLVKHRRAHSPCTAGLGLGSGAKSPIPSLNILVVDDSPAILKVVGRALTNEGHEVKTAKNGYVGLTMMKESLVAGSLDMVIIDMQMPVMDGLETVTRFREHEARLRYDDFQVDRTVTSESEADLIAPMPSAATAEVSTGQSVEGSLTDLLGGLPPSTVPASAFTPLEVEVMAPSRTNSCGSGGSESSSWEPAEPPLIALSDDVCVASSPALGVTLRNDSAFMNAPKIARRKPDPRMPRDRCHVGVQSKCSTGGMNQNSQPAIPQFPQASRSCAEDLFIVGMSANNNCETQEMALKAGMDAFIVKPFSFKDLEYILRTRNFH
jgi:CheY-like chemotaxis protein